MTYINNDRGRDGIFAPPTGFMGMAPGAMCHRFVPIILP